MKILFLPLLLLLAFASEGLSQFHSGDWVYSLDPAKQATITGYNGPGGAVSIPSVIEGHAVTAVGVGWSTIFGAGDIAVTSVTIPDSVTTIGGSAFLAAVSLANVTIPGSVTTIGDFAFDRCTSLTSVTIPTSVTAIGDGAFSECTGLTSVSIPARFSDELGRIFGGELAGNVKLQLKE